MALNRRNWIKQIGLGTAGLGLTGFPFVAAADHLSSPHNTETPIRLIANENPYAPTPAQQTAIKNALSKTNRYGGEYTNQLKTALAKHHNVSTEHILIGAGSTQILELTGLYAASQKGSSVLPQPTFDHWSYGLEKMGLRRIEVPATDNRSIDLEKVINATEPDTKLIYICNPNNPTGTICKADSLRDFITEAGKKAIILVDEAYLEYTNEPSVSDMIDSNKNLIVAKTFSKIYGLAGMRIGYALAHPDTIKSLSAFTSWPGGSHSVLATAAALASLEDKNFVKMVKESNISNRAYTINGLTKQGIQCIPSNTNFIYFSLQDYKKDYFSLLDKNNIIATRIYEEAGKWTRVTIGTFSEMKQFVKAIS